ncbi:MAG: cysteine synthase A [Acholeplasmataceae bacterium]
MNIYQNYTDLIGKTPLLRLKHIEKKYHTYAEIDAKLENFNPLSSVKDRLALALVKSLEASGQLHENSVIIEPTSGNTGVGLAFICAAKKYDLILVMPSTVSEERVKIARALGAKVVLTDGTKGIKGTIAYVNQALKEHPNYVTAMQFENLANPEMHRKTTAIELINDTENHIDYFVCGVGTGGTITGVGEVLKQHNKDVKIIAVEPKDSPVLSGGEPGPHTISGIGAGFIPPVLNQKIIDQIITISNEDAYTYARELAKEEGVFAGVSSGAALYAAIQIAKQKKNKGKRVVVLIPDTGERYLSTPLYNDNV